jgi:AcrR family transcriptional regulator
MNTSRAEIGQRKRARTRAALVDAAMRVIARTGPDNMTVDEIIAEAAVARGTFYNYFTTRDDVLLAVGIAISERLLGRMQAQRSLADPADRVGRAIRSFIRMAAADAVAGWVIVRIALLAAPMGTSMRDYLMADVTDGMASGRFRAHSAQAACDAILGLGMMGMRSVLRNEAPAGHAEHIAEMALRALAVPDAEDVAHRPFELPAG